MVKNETWKGLAWGVDKRLSDLKRKTYFLLLFVKTSADEEKALSEIVRTNKPKAYRKDNIYISSWFLLWSYSALNVYLCPLPFFPLILVFISHEYEFNLLLFPVVVWCQQGGLQAGKTPILSPECFLQWMFPVEMESAQLWSRNTNQSSERPFPAQMCFLLLSSSCLRSNCNIYWQKLY